METRNDKFRRLSELRLSRIFQNMNLIANLSAPKYTYTNDDIEELFNTYQKLGVIAREYFNGPTRYNEMPSSFEFTNSSTEPSKPEINHERFRRLAENRMSRVVRDLRLLCNLSDKSNYSYSDDEINELFNAYSEKGREVKIFFTDLTDEFHFKTQD